MKRFLIFALSFALLFAVSIPAFAKTVDDGDPSLPTTAPSVADVWDSASYPYALVTYNSNGEYWFSCSSSVFYSSGYPGTIKTSGSSKTYKLNSNYEWIFQSNNPSQHGIQTQLILSTHDIEHDDNGNIVFNATPDFFNPPPPLAEVIQGVAMEELETTTLPQMGGTMKILVVCGVGLMACLVVLSLFSKKLLFLSR